VPEESRSKWSQVRIFISVAVGPLASFFLTFYLLRWAATLDRHYIVSANGQGEVRTHPWLFVGMGFVGALPAMAGAVIGPRGRRWAGALMGIACIAVGFLCEAVVQFFPQPWFTF
jgi:hypothetical protein